MGRHNFVHFLHQKDSIVAVSSEKAVELSSAHARKLATLVEAVGVVWSRSGLGKTIAEAARSLVRAAIAVVQHSGRAVGVIKSPVDRARNERKRSPIQAASA